MNKESSGSDIDGQPSPIDFVEFLPWACGQLRIEVMLIVNKVVQDEYISAISTDRKLKPKSKARLVTSKTEASDNEKQVNDSCASLSFTNSRVIVKLQAIHDNNDKLVHINIEKNSYMIHGILKIIALIVKFHTFLNTITIRGIINENIITELANILSLSHITEMILDDTELDNKCYQVLLSGPNELKHLSLARCQLNDDSAKQIATQLEYPSIASKSLSILNLTTNRITDVGVNYLAESLKSNRQLSYLNLSDNKLTDEGAFKILAVLIEFPLTFEEVLQSRGRHLEYLKERNKLIDKIIEILRSSDMDKKPRRKSQRPTSTSSKKTKSIEKEGSFKSIPDAVSKGIDDVYYEKALSMAEDELGEFFDPYSSKDILTTKDGTVCKGNNTLAYLNLAYNNLSFLFLPALVKVFSYQKMMARKPKGLVNVIIEGNDLPESCKELSKIDFLIEMGFITMRRTSVVRKRANSIKMTPRL